MDIKKVIVWIIVVVLVGGAAYYGYKYYGAKSAAPATTTGETTTPPNQVQGQEVKVGTGAEAIPGTIVTVEYEGKLTDGTVFDSSAAQGKPLVFTLGSEGIIPGFQVGVNGMKVGGERLLAVPPSLAYGAEQVGTIPPNSTLIFNVKLIKVEEPAPAAETAPAN
ncbi:MAG: FKBP-type peptidyl-prolyl cis-trans isomerase [bacterium]|nr:FKBP-type peptidyl-prolyl cis-trans isomerase [bacterium]